jgi:hypothetical protein
VCQSKPVTTQAQGGAMTRPRDTVHAHKTLLSHLCTRPQSLPVQAFGVSGIWPQNDQLQLRRSKQLRFITEYSILEYSIL